MQENNGDGSEKQSGLSWSEPTPLTKQAAPAKTPAATPAANASAANTMNSARLIGMVVVGIFLGVVVAWAWVALRSSSTSVAEDNTNGIASSTSTPGTGSSSAFSIVSPQAAGKSVAIEKASVAAPTWVVVYEDKDGKPGNALGAALFFPSRQTGTVELLRATTPGKNYLIARQVDNGDRKFSLKNDKLVAEDGVVQWVTLEVR